MEMSGGKTEICTTLLVLYVSQEQEKAIKALYTYHAWSLNNIGQNLTESVQKEIQDTANDYKPHVGENTKSMAARALNDPPKQSSCSFDETSKEIDNSSENEKSSEICNKSKKAIHETPESEASEKEDDLESSSTEVVKTQGSTGSKCKQNRKNSKDFFSTIGGKRFMCKQCSYKTNKSSNLLRHVHEVHYPTRHQCSKCDKTFSSKHEAKKHELHAHDNKLKCDKCDKEFTSRSGLFNHCKIVHDQKCHYKCNECDMMFLYKPHYDGHMNSHKLKKPFTCSDCNRPFSYKTSLNQHRKVCKGENFQNDADGNKKIEKQKYLCDICGDELSTAKSLKTHHDFVHCAVDKLSCEQCGKTFKGKYNLRRHEKLVHVEPVAMHVCNICNQTFSRPEVLRQHIQRHKKEYIAQCSSCGKGFYSNYKLKEHERSHTGEKPFSCEICGNYKCSTKSNLLKHYKTHKEHRVNEKKKTKKADKVEQSDHLSLPSLPSVSHHEPAIMQLPPSLATESEEFYKRHQNLQPLPSQHLSHGDMHSQYVAGQCTDDCHTNRPPNNQLVNMTMPSEMLSYDQPQYTLLQPSDGHYDDRGYYGDGSHGNSTTLPQNMNILTMAMNLANAGHY